MRLLAVLILAGCTPIERTFHCAGSGQCVNGGTAGTCEATGWCSFPDGNCAGGRRYASLSGDGLAGQCVGSVAPSGCVQAIALGDAHGCALRTDGSAACWGKNDHGQLGNGATGDAAAATAVLDDHGAPLAHLTAIAAGAAHTCARRDDGAILCWGDDSAGQLGAGGAAAVNAVPMPASISSVAAIAAGAHHTCVALTTGAVWCWGANDSGQLGSGSAGSSMPVEVTRAGLALDAILVTAGATHSCAVERDKTLVCWGSDVDGELGDATTAATSGPVQAMALGAHVTAAAAGPHFGCALGDDQRVSCFGLDDRGQAGATSPTVAVPTALSLDLVDAIAAGGTEACARRSGSALWCWGNGAMPAHVADGVAAFAVGAADACRAQSGSIACDAFGDPRLSCP